MEFVAIVLSVCKLSTKQSASRQKHSSYITDYSWENPPHRILKFLAIDDIRLNSDTDTVACINACFTHCYCSFDNSGQIWYLNVALQFNNTASCHDNLKLQVAPLPWKLPVSVSKYNTIPTNNLVY